MVNNAYQCFIVIVIKPVLFHVVLSAQMCVISCFLGFQLNLNDKKYLAFKEISYYNYKKEKICFRKKRPANLEFHEPLVLWGHFTYSIFLK